MTITALNEILVNLANSDFRVNQAYTGDVYDINTKENRFGCFVATPMTATRNDGGVITYHYVMYFIDRLTDDEANMDLIQTDAVNVLKRVIDNLGYNGIETGEGYIFTLFKHQFDDWCAGAFVDIDFIVPDMDCQEFEIGKEVDLRPITITENGTYLPDGFDGFSSVLVNVEGGSDVTKEWVEEEIDRKTQDLATKEELAGKADKSEIPSLEGYATEEFVTSQGYLTEHQPLKTINNISLIGNGNINIGGGVTEEWVNQAIEDKTAGMVTDDSLEIKLEEYPTKGWVEEQGYLTEVPSDYAKKTDIPDVSNFATKDEMGDKVDEAAFDDYKSEVNTALSGKADKSEIPTLPSYLGDNNIAITDGKYSSILKGNALTINLNGTEKIRIDGGSGYHYGGTRYGDGKIWFNNQSETLIFADIATKSEIPDVSGFATQEFVNETDGARKQWVIDQGYLTEHQSLAGYATESWVEGKGYLTEHQDISGLATKAEVEAVEGKIPSLTGYATESWVEGKGYLTEHQDISGLATKAEVEAVEGKIPSLTGYATESWVEGKGYLTEHQDISGKVDKSSIWTGTQAQWDALTDAQKASYTIALIRA